MSEVYFPDLPDFARLHGEATWAATRPLRSGYHADGVCRLNGKQATAAWLLGRAQEGHQQCFEVFEDALLYIVKRCEHVLAANNPVAYGATVAQRFVIDRGRSERSDRYARAKSDCTRGVPRRVADALDNDWQRFVFAHLLWWVGAPAPVSADRYGVERLIESYGTYHPHSCLPIAVVRATVAQDVLLVIARIDQIAGRGWRHDVIDAPLNYRLARYSAIPLEPHDNADGSGPQIADDAEPDLLGGQLRAQFRANLQQHGPWKAAQGAIAAVTGATAPIPATVLLETVARWLAELAVEYIGVDRRTGRLNAPITRETLLFVIGAANACALTPRLWTAIRRLLPPANDAAA